MPTARQRPAFHAWKTDTSIERPFASNISESLAVKHSPRWSPVSISCRSRWNGRTCFLFTMTDNTRYELPAKPFSRCKSSPTRNFFLKGRDKPAALSSRYRAKPRRSTVWWSQTGSNRRPHACKARALPTELWPRAGNRCERRETMVGLGRLELPTSRLSSARSNQLSYKPKPIAGPQP